jgi:PhnB protein
MATDSAARASIRTSLAPWLSVRDAAKAIDFYKSAFAAAEVYRLDGEGGALARLSIDGAEFWVGEESPEQHNSSSASLQGSVRMILTVADPDAVFARVCRAGATEVYPVSEEHGWRIGRLKDPFGHDWEIGRELAS